VILRSIQHPGSVTEGQIAQQLTFGETEAKSSTFCFMNLDNIAIVYPNLK